MLPVITITFPQILPVVALLTLSSLQDRDEARPSAGRYREAGTLQEVSPQEGRGTYEGRPGPGG